jgi:hypothetical protein
MLYSQYFETNPRLGHRQNRIERKHPVVVNVMSTSVVCTANDSIYWLGMSK